MSAVYREIELVWRGKSYKVTPDYGLIQRIEQHISLASLLTRTLAGQPPLSQLADLLSIVLASQGCPQDECEAEDIHAELWNGEQDLVAVSRDLLLELLPKEKEKPGNGKAPEAAEPTPMVQPTSSGASTTQ